MSNQKGKSKEKIKNTMIPIVPNLDELHLVDVYFKITKTKCEFNLLELQNWEFQKYEDVRDEFRNWKSMLPQFIFPQTYHFPEFVSWCENKFLHNKNLKYL